MAAAEDGDTLLVSVILGSGPVEIPGETDWGFDNFERGTITQGDTPVASVAVTMSRETDSVMVKPQGSITRTLPKDLDLEAIETDITLFSQSVEAPVEEGEVLGAMKLSYDGETYGTLDLVAVNSVERSELLYRLDRIQRFFNKLCVKIVLVVLAVLIVFLILRRLILGRGRSRYGSSSRGGYRGGRRYSGRRRR